MKFSSLSLLFAATLFGLTACQKEANELAHNHSHHEHETEQHGSHDEHGHNHAHGHEGHDHSAHHANEGGVHEGHDHAEHAHEHGVEQVKADAHNHAEGADVIVLESCTAKRFGVKTQKAELKPFAQSVKVSGEVYASAEGDAIVSAPTSGIITIVSGMNNGSQVRSGQVVATIRAEGVSGGDVNQAAKAELDAAEAEWKRIEPLYKRRLVTQNQYNTAKAAYERARAAYSTNAAGGSAVSPITGVITSLDAKSGQYVQVGTPIASVAASTRLNLHADLPAKYYSLLPQFKDARVRVPYTDLTITLSNLDAKRLNSADATAGARAGYVPVVFSFRNDGSFVPGTAVEVYLLGDNSRNAITLPRTALSEQQGKYFVYEQLDADCYRKMPVEVGTSDGLNVEITSGLHGGENIVVEGVTTVRLAQAGGSVPSGHSHSH